MTEVVLDLPELGEIVGLRHFVFSDLQFEGAGAEALFLSDLFEFFPENVDFFEQCLEMGGFLLLETLDGLKLLLEDVDVFLGLVILVIQILYFILDALDLLSVVGDEGHVLPFFVLVVFFFKLSGAFFFFDEKRMG